MRHIKGKQTKSELVRKQTQEILKEREDWCRQIDLIRELQKANGQEVQMGVYNGVLYKMSGKGEIYIPIPNVKVKKVGRKVFYRYG